MSWEFMEGYFEKLHENVLIMASAAGDKGTIDALPFDPSETVRFDNRYLGDWVVELYKTNETQAFDEAEKVLNAEIKNQAEYKIKGKAQREFRKLAFIAEKTCVTFRYVWLPVWMATYSYQGKHFHLMVNAQTGKVSGKRPLSLIKIIVAVVGTLIVLLILAFLVAKL